MFRQGRWACLIRQGELESSGKVGQVECRGRLGHFGSRLVCCLFPKQVGNHDTFHCGGVNVGRALV